VCTSGVRLAVARTTQASGSVRVVKSAARCSTRCSAKCASSVRHADCERILYWHTSRRHAVYACRSHAARKPPIRSHVPSREPSNTQAERKLHVSRNDTVHMRAALMRLVFKKPYAVARLGVRAQSYSLLPFNKKAKTQKIQISQLSIPICFISPPPLKQTLQRSCQRFIYNNNNN
jgi:hypothetical protein